IVWLFGLVAVLQVFALDAVLAPIQGLLNGVMEFLPNVIGAAFVLFIGYVIAKIAGQLVETSVGMVDFGGIASRMKKVGPTPGAQTGARSAAPAGDSADRPAESAGTQFSGGAAPDTPGGSGIDSRKLGSILGNLVFAIILIVVAIAALQILRISAISD